MRGMSRRTIILLAVLVAAILAALLLPRVETHWDRRPPRPKPTAADRP
jgi:hypothetical protein